MKYFINKFGKKIKILIKLIDIVEIKLNLIKL